MEDHTARGSGLLHIHYIVILWRKGMSEEYLKILEKALEGIELTEEENRLVEWIAGWDLWTVRQFRQIIKNVVSQTIKILKGGYKNYV